MKIELKDISFSYKDGKDSKQIFLNFSRNINEGEFLSILGPSGCGKSTLLNIIGGLLKPENGQVILGDTDYYSLSESKRDKFRRNHIGYIFQKFYLIEDIGIIDNIMITMSDRLKKSDKKNRILEILEELNIKDKIDSKISNLSGGEQQRVAIARAIAQESDILICDEPTGNLDENNAMQIMKILKRLNARGITIIMVTHNRELCSYADTVLELTESIRIGGIK